MDISKLNTSLLSTPIPSSSNVISEYSDNYNGNRLINSTSRTEQYVSKKVHDESEFWKGGKYAYDCDELKKNIIYLSTSRQDYIENIIPNEFISKKYNMKKTFISEYANMKKGI